MSSNPLMPLTARIDSLCQDAAFHAWFGGSAVRDASGRPLAVFHGTDVQDDFDVFTQTNDWGFHFGTAACASRRLEQISSGLDADEIVHYRLIPAFLHIENPLDIGDQHTWQIKNILAELETRRIVSAREADLIYDSFDDNLLRAAIERAGYDGLRYTNETEGGISWMVWRPEQIKGVFTSHWERVSPRLSGAPCDPAALTYDIEAAARIGANLAVARKSLGRRPRR